MYKYKSASQRSTRTMEVPANVATSCNNNAIPENSISGIYNARKQVLMCSLLEEVDAELLKVKLEAGGII